MSQALINSSISSFVGFWPSLPNTSCNSPAVICPSLFLSYTSKVSLKALRSSSVIWACMGECYSIFQWIYFACKQLSVSVIGPLHTFTIQRHATQLHSYTVKIQLSRIHPYLPWSKSGRAEDVTKGQVANAFQIKIVQLYNIGTPETPNHARK